MLPELFEKTNTQAMIIQVMITQMTTSYISHLISYI